MDMEQVEWTTNEDDYFEPTEPDTAEVEDYKMRVQAELLAWMTEYLSFSTVSDLVRLLGDNI